MKKWIGLAVVLSVLVSSPVAGQGFTEKRSLATAKEQASIASQGALLTHTKEAACLREGILMDGSVGSRTVTGSLSADDCDISHDLTYWDFWTFNGTAGNVVTVDLSSSDFDTVLWITDPTGVAYARNNDFGGSTNSHIVFTLPTTQTTWQIAVTANGLNATGNYTLTLTVQDQAPPGCGSAEILCLNSDQFTVLVDWSTTDGRSGSGQAVPMSGDSGYFWFFNAANVELVVKVLDGRAINGHYWVFYGALTDVHYRIRVTNTLTQVENTYENPQGQLASVADTSAF